MNLTEEKVLAALSNIQDPDLKKDIVSLNLIKNLVIENELVRFNVEVKSPTMHSRTRMEEACEFNIKRVLGNHIKVEVSAVAVAKEQPPAKENKLPNIKNIIAVASGKGGVGKSTVASNLAVGLAQKGFKVGLLDADIYGPSAPTMFDLVHEKPASVEVDGKSKIQPLESYGVKVLSIGFFAGTDQAVVWRGPMATKALQQLIFDAHWEELDYLIVDLPPGTGDIHLSIVQAVSLTGAIIVSTPQDVALADARKGIGMFKMPSINVPVLGMVENMSYFTPEELPENKYYIFGKEGAQQLAEQLNVPFLGELPIVQSIREAGDIGRPAILQENTISANAFEKIIDNFVSEVEKRNQKLPPTEKVEITTMTPNCS